MKVVVVEELGCGKSSLTQQKLMSAPTIGLELSVKMVEAPDGTPIKCQIWDCSGKMMSGIQPNYLANACAVVLCYEPLVLHGPRGLAVLRTPQLQR